MGYHYKVLLKKETQNAYYWCQEKWPYTKGKTWSSWYETWSGRQFRFSRKSDYMEFMLTWQDSNNES
jgi:hypothetical protein